MKYKYIYNLILILFSSSKAPGKCEAFQNDGLHLTEEGLVTLSGSSSHSEVTNQTIAISTAESHPILNRSGRKEYDELSSFKSLSMYQTKENSLMSITSWLDIEESRYYLSNQHLDDSDVQKYENVRKDTLDSQSMSEHVFSLLKTKEFDSTDVNSTPTSRKLFAQILSKYSGTKSSDSESETPDEMSGTFRRSEYW